MKLIKPNLAGTLDNLADCPIPACITPKFDGIRAMVQNGIVYSRTLKPIPNVHVQKKFGRVQYEGCDGELVIGDPTDPMCFRKTTSVVMSDTKPANEVEYFVFDVLDKKKPYNIRTVDKRINVTPVIVSSLAALRMAEQDFVTGGWEGIIMRGPSSMYKEGRSTLKEEGLLKYKRFFDDEAEIISWEPEYENTNPKETNELGRSKRSSKKEGLIPLDTVGALNVRWKGQEFSIGSGLTEDESAKLWDIRDKLPGMKVKFKYQLAAGKPRFPIYLGLRHKWDM